MNTSTSIIKISMALLLAQREIGSAKKGSNNPFFHSKYADLGSVMEACKDALNDNGIVVLQPVGNDEQGQYVETILLHETGEFISDKMRIVMKESNNPQAQGSAISYARRYSLQSMMFIPAADDDAESAKPDEPSMPTPGAPVTDAQLTLLNDLAMKAGKTKDEIEQAMNIWMTMTKLQASVEINRVKNLK